MNTIKVDGRAGDVFSQSACDNIKYMDPLRYHEIGYEYSVITGPGGTGKTFTIATIIKDLMKEGKYKIVCLTPTNKAMNILRTDLLDQKVPLVYYTTSKIKDIDDRVLLQTTASFFGYNPRYNIDGTTREVYNMPKIKTDRHIIFFIDEASMLNDTTLYNIESFICQHWGVHTVIFIGDRYQLPPIKTVDGKMSSESESRIFKIAESFPGNRTNILTINQRADANNDMGKLNKFIRDAAEKGNYDVGQHLYEMKKQFSTKTDHVRLYENNERFHKKLLSFHNGVNKDKGTVLYISCSKSSVDKCVNRVTKNVYDSKFDKGVILHVHDAFPIGRDGRKPLYIKKSSNMEIIDCGYAEQVRNEYFKESFSCRKCSCNPNLDYVRTVDISILEESEKNRFKKILSAKRQEIKTVLLKYSKAQGRTKKEIDDFSDKLWGLFNIEKASVNAPMSPLIALTTYGAQGSTIDYVFVNYTSIMWYYHLFIPHNVKNREEIKRTRLFKAVRELYTACSRTKKCLFLLV